MELKHIDIAQLSVSSANMRGKAKKPDLTNILPSVRARGILVPLIVRPSAEDGGYEIVAGKRRYQAAVVVAQETGESEALPCAVIEPGDDAAPDAGIESAAARMAGTGRLSREARAHRPELAGLAIRRQRDCGQGRVVRHWQLHRRDRLRPVRRGQLFCQRR
jgi:ParB-like chromosome segregation protein Spo0J